MDIPGSPKPDDNSGKPKQNPKKISFTLEDLIFQNVFNVDGHSYITFICVDKYIISMKKWDYFELLNAVYEIMEDEEDDVVVTISPDYDEIDEKVELQVTKFDVEKNTIENSTKQIPHYTVFNLLTNLSPDIRETNFNLN